MKRQVLTDGSGRWFDLESAEVFDEDTRWNGRNKSSCATGSQWEHETLYRTKSDRWILSHKSQWEGHLPSWTEMEATAAARWLSINGYEAHETLQDADKELEIS